MPFSGCSPGWTFFPHTSRCYRHFSKAKTWENARDFCVASSLHYGDLVSIPDQATNDFLTQLSDVISWIGATDAASEGNWQWSDGTPWGYESWAAGEPNNGGGLGQNYGAINYFSTGLWDDDDSNRPFFCQYLSFFIWTGDSSLVEQQNWAPGFPIFGL